MAPQKREGELGETISMSFDMKEFRRMVRAGDREYKLAGARALNDTSRAVRTRTLRGVSRFFSLPQKVLKPRVVQRRARPHRLHTSIIVYSRPVNPARLNPRQTGRGVTAGGHRFPGAFVHLGRADLKNVVLKRKGSARRPLRAEKIHIFSEAIGILRRVTERAAKDILPRVLQRELNFRLKRAARRGGR